MQVTLRQAIEPHPALRNNLLTVLSILDTLRGSVTCADIELDDEIPETHAMVLWAYAYILACDVLTERPLLSTIGVYRLELLQYVQQCAVALAEHPDADLRPLLLGVANREVVSLSTAPGWYDLRNARRTTDRPVVFEGISYNLAYPIKIEWLRLQEQQNAEQSLPTNPRVS